MPGTSTRSSSSPSARTTYPCPRSSTRPAPASPSGIRPSPSRASGSTTGTSAPAKSTTPRHSGPVSTDGRAANPGRVVCTEATSTARTEPPQRTVTSRRTGAPAPSPGSSCGAAARVRSRTTGTPGRLRTVAASSTLTGQPVSGWRNTESNSSSPAVAVTGTSVSAGTRTMPRTSSTSRPRAEPPCATTTVTWSGVRGADRPMSGRRSSTGSTSVRSRIAPSRPSAATGRPASSGGQGTTSRSEVRGTATSMPASRSRPKAALAPVGTTDVPGAGSGGVAGGIAGGMAVRSRCRRWPAR